MRVQLRLPFAVLLALGIGNIPPASAGALDLGSLAAGAFVIALGAEDEDEASEGADAAVDTADESSDEMAADEDTDDAEQLADEDANAEREAASEETEVAQAENTPDAAAPEESSALQAFSKERRDAGLSETQKSILKATAEGGTGGGRGGGSK